LLFFKSSEKRKNRIFIRKKKRKEIYQKGRVIEENILVRKIEGHLNTNKQERKRREK